MKPPVEYILTNAGIFDGTKSLEGEVHVRGEWIVAVGSQISNSRVPRIDVADCWILPGLINAHDHLDFTPFPRLGNRTYANSYDWADDVSGRQDERLSSCLSLTMDDRLLWGGLKCLLSGVTTVMHHNPMAPILTQSGSIDQFPARVIPLFRWSHSLRFGKDLEREFKTHNGRGLYFIHCAEGTDEVAHSELHELNERGLLDSRTVLIHGVGLTANDLPLLRSSGGKLVWCPSSNMFLFGRTVDPEVLRSGIPLALGSDSSISANGHLIDELRAAAQCGVFSPSEVLKLVTSDAARVLDLNDGRGCIRPGGIADLLLIHRISDDPAQDLIGSTLDRIEAVIRGGKLLLRKAQGRISSCLAGIESPADQHRIERLGLHQTTLPVSRLVDRTPAQVLRHLPQYLRDSLGQRSSAGEGQRAL